jgi:hypothetical protein
LGEISAGHYHVCGIETGGKAFCWGRNTSGQLGNGTTMERHAVPVAVSGTHRFSSITAGATHTCALDQEHRAWCWGRGVEGRLGNDTGKDSSEPVEVAGGLRFQSLSAGSQHTCGVAENGDLYCWGGILGSGMSRAGVDAPDAFVPLLVKTNLKFRTVSAGGDLSCAVSAEADAYCWSSTEAANVRGLPRPTSLHIAAVPGRHKFTAISAGIDHACGVTTDSRVYCWGANDSGQLGSGSIEDTLIPVAAAVDVAFDSVAAGFQQTCAVSGTSTWCWGRNQSKDGRPTRFAALGGGPGELRPPTPPAASPAALAVGGKIPPMDWKGTLERPLFGFPDACQAADLEFSGQQNAFTLQLKCQTIVNETLSLALKSEGGARTITGQVNTRKLSQEKIDQWAAQLETEVLSLTEALAYPAFLAKPARALVHASGRIDRLEFDSSQRLRYVSATTSKEILFDQYKPVDGVSVPFEIRLNTKEEISVLKLREIRFR